MIKILIKLFSTKLYDLAVALAAFLSSKILKNIDKVSVLGIIIMILKHFTKSKPFQYIIIILKMVYAILSSYAIILYFSPYYSHIEIVDSSLKYITDSITFYKNNLTEAYDILMHGKKPEVIIESDDTKDPFSYYNDKKTYNLGQESDNTTWYNSDYFKTLLALGIGALTGYILYYYGHDIYQFIISNLTNRDPGSGGNPDGTQLGSNITSDVNSRNLPSQGKIITYFAEKVKSRRAYDYMGTHAPKPYNLDSPTSSIGSDTPPLTRTPRPTTSQLDLTPQASTSKLPESFTSDESFNPNFD